MSGHSGSIHLSVEGLRHRYLENERPDHPTVGVLSLHREKMSVGDLILVVYYPEPHSTAAEKLRLLATLRTEGSDLMVNELPSTEE